VRGRPPLAFTAWLLPSSRVELGSAALVRGVWRLKILAFWWYLVGPVWPRVVLVGRVGILLVALVQRITVVPNAKTRLPSVAMNLISSADVRMAPVIGDKAPYRGKRGSDRPICHPGVGGPPLAPYRSPAVPPCNSSLAVGHGGWRSSAPITTATVGWSPSGVLRTKGALV
jgi:hypothetical protein